MFREGLSGWSGGQSGWNPERRGKVRAGGGISLREEATFKWEYDRKKYSEPCRE